MQDPNKITFDPRTKVSHSTHGSKEDNVTGTVLKEAHLICPVMVNGQQLYGHVRKTFMFEGYGTLLWPTQVMAGQDVVGGNMVPRVAPCSALAKDFDYFTKDKK